MRMSKRHQEQVSVTRKGGEQIYSRTHMEQLLKEMSILFAPLIHNVLTLKTFSGVPLETIKPANITFVNTFVRQNSKQMLFVFPCFLLASSKAFLLFTKSLTIWSKCIKKAYKVSPFVFFNSSGKVFFV